MLFTVFAKSQNNIDVVFNETSLNNALKVIKDARGLNFGEYQGRIGLNAWFLNLDNANIDIKPNNKVVINGVRLSGGVDLDLWAFNWTPTGNLTGSIDGKFEVSGNTQEGYYLHIVPTNCSLTYSGTLQSVVELVRVLTNNFLNLIPDIEVNLGTSLLPDQLLKYFKTGIPNITTTDTEIKLSFELLFDDLIIKNKNIKSGENSYYTASNSIIFKDGFSVSAGATFNANITQKNNNNLRSSEYSDEKRINIGDSLISNGTMDFTDGNVSDDTSTNISPNDISDINSLTPFSIQVYDMNGRLLFDKKEISDKSEIDLSFLTKGIYIVKFSSKDIFKSKKLFVK
jgi:hypothetical protein